MQFKLSPIFILKNPIFRKIVFFNKPQITKILIFSMISTLIFSSFPLIARAYVDYIYYQDLFQLLFFTIFFAIIYLIKLVLDIKIERYKIKYFLKIEKNLQELVLKKYSKNIKKLIEKKLVQITKDIRLYSLLIKTIHLNFIDLLKIIFISIIIFFFDFNLFLYFSIAVPFFIIFYVLLRKETAQLKLNKKYAESDFVNLVHKLKDKSEIEFFNIGLKNLELNLEKNLTMKTKKVKLSELIKSFVGFYRLFYLFYFGIYIILFSAQISNLIIGLLFLTILIRAFSNLLKSAPIYIICSKSFFRINSMVNEYA